MTPIQSPSVAATPLLRGGALQRLRIASGLILFAFALTHFLNHALGIWSIEAMDTVQAWRTAVTRSTLGSTVLAAALVTHIALNIWKIGRRSTWRLPVWEALQIALGLAIPVLLFVHLAQMRGHYILLDTATRYSETLPDLWNGAALRQTALLLVVWVHGCIGLHFWLRLSAAYRRIAPVLLVLAVLIPTLALTGFVVAGRDAAAQAAATAPAVPDADYDYYSDYGAPQAEPLISDPVLEGTAWYSAWALIGIVAVTLAIRALLRRRGRRIRVSYTAGPSIVAPVGPTLLELSRMSGVPHTSICGGRARCSTCRVRIEDGAGGLPEPNQAEAATLKQIHAGPDIRLACQLRPRHDLAVTRMIRPPEERRAILPGVEESGVERILAILFLDIRGFTALSEVRLPYDTVFLLNRFFAEVGEATNAAGGWIDKYMGDGMMALFGINRSAEAACRSALIAAMHIDSALERLNHELQGELATPLKIGVGLHVGPLVLGRIGHRGSAATTVIGPAVNVASRLEGLTKEHGVQIVASAALARQAGLPSGVFPEIVVAVRGTSDPVAVLLIKEGRDLAPYLGDEGRRSAA
jgi:adenylate cyclase